MAASNYDDVLHQLRAFGLVVDVLQVGTDRMVRTKVEGDREKRGWYILHEFTTSRGDLLIVGSFGAWRGNENHARKVELRKVEIDPVEAAALKRRLAEDRKRADEARKRDADKAADAATVMWARLSEDGDSDYLADKKVPGLPGLRYTANGTAVIPLLDTQGRIHGLQFLRTPAAAERSKRPAKEFWPKGIVKKGHFHLIGSPSWIVLIAEGYATAATLHTATHHPVAVAFDAGNLLPVAEALRKRYPQTKILICADNDDLGKCRVPTCRARLSLALNPSACPDCGEPHGYVNAGIGGASTAALSVKGSWVAPAFADPDARVEAYLSTGAKPTDFNDLHAAEGLHVVRVQVEAHLTALRWNPKLPAASTTTSGAGAALRPIETTQELMERFALVASTPVAVFDRQEHRLRTLADMREMCTHKWVHRGWSESPDRQIVRDSEVGFDPTGQDATVTCNLYAGWPTTPKEGNCERLLDLLRYMCSEDRNPDALYQWLLRWIAYPIQHPGAKMKTTLVLHGPQGAGKNLFFEAVMKIYGEYGDVLDQAAVEDKFNDWASRKLFMIADEVVARSGAYHIKNQLKSLITGDRIRINPKNMAAHWERNHLNLVFLSNESMPVVIEEDDRRHCVVWTPGKESREYYMRVMAEIAAGGIAALHHYLLHLDLGEFDNGTLPPTTEAKSELIKLGLDSPVRFYDELLLEEIPKVDPMPGLTTDWYEIYKTWCAKHGYRHAPEAKFVIALVRQRGVLKARKRYRPASELRGPHWFLFPREQAPPEGAAEADWLGQSYTRHREQLDEYRGRLQAGSGAL